MKKYVVIGNPIDHSLSPKLHNFWFKKNKINAVYEKKLMNLNNLPEILKDLRTGKITGLNVTVPFKKDIIKHVDELTQVARTTQSINTIYKKSDKIIGDNTDAGGFGSALNYINFDAKNKTILILGAGGVVSSLIFTLNKTGANIIVTNRTLEKANQLKKNFPNIKIIEWGKKINADMVINATSIGLNEEDKFNIDLSNIKNKLFYDVIYNLNKTDFLRIGEEHGNRTENGMMMFLYQAKLSFKIWHGINLKIDSEVISFLKMFKIGITGSIASGKTTVAKILASDQKKIFNADKIVKDIYKKKSFKKLIKSKFKIKKKKKTWQTR